MSSSSAWDRRIPNNGDLSQSPVYAGTCSTTSGYLPDPRICIFFWKEFVIIQSWELTQQWKITSQKLPILQINSLAPNSLSWNLRSH